MAMNKIKSSKLSGTGEIDLRAIVLAGGSGTRFWPLSRQRSPKQYLKITSDKPLIEETVNRIKGLVPNSRIYSVAISSQTRILRRLLPRLPEKNFLVEPEARNTAASLILATAVIYLENPEAVMIALPADHFISEVEAFREKLLRAARAAYEFKKIVMFGIPPTSPATAYGYIHISSKHSKKVDGEKFYKVKGFREKPDLPSALEFIQSGDYYWNSGIFLWRADTFEENLREFAPELFSAWIKLLSALRRHDRREIARVFREIPALSIDYALIEKVTGSLMNPGNFGWSDLGSWGSLYEYLPKDEACNSSRDRLLTLDARNCLVLNPGQITALIGVENLMVINSGDALLICKKDQDQRVKELVEKLKKDLPEYV
ncbi:MAG: sugar phosphate nucleotidyltransferase [Acidobacteriota bacterium]|nr:sugar phosphate nucleotidyltransferase [Acidobacteriota bacterium]MDY0231331.1 sugar phosphate nucleotidyltransferase [Candidatus Saccharicenans sp.]